MMRITYTDYMMGRDITHSMQLTPDIEHNAEITVGLINDLLKIAAADGIDLPMHPANRSHVSSGWRPPTINAATPRASQTSRHMSGQAVDIYDPRGMLDAWCMQHTTSVLQVLGLWLEDPAATPGWCHLQTVPPGSGRRVFVP